MTVIDAVPCTTVARTLMDLGMSLDERRLSRAVETAERLLLLDVRSLRLLMGRHRGRRGVGRLRRVMAAYDPDFLRVRSELEARFLQLCIDVGADRPLVNHRIEARSEVFEVDFHWPDRRLIVETDGSSFHGTTAARARDAHRDDALAAAGWTLIRCTWSQVNQPPRWAGWPRLLRLIRPSR